VRGEGPISMGDRGQPAPQLEGRTSTPGSTQATHRDRQLVVVDPTVPVPCHNRAWHRRRPPSLLFFIFFPQRTFVLAFSSPFLPCHPVCRHIAAVHLWFVVRVCLTATLLRFIIVRCFRVSAGLLNTCVDATGFDSSSVLLSPRGIILTILMFCDDVAVILGSFVF